MQVLGAVRRGKKERFSFPQLGEGILTSLESLQTRKHVREARDHESFAVNRAWEMLSNVLLLTDVLRGLPVQSIQRH